ncbi:MAG TPA: class I SAM-dependent methyltransferase [Chitinophagaceae bacterium]|nr:class I SAM-dependent methyltransferase [Chitinophagaceae bacterium]
MIDVQEIIACLYCGGEAKLFEKNARHPYAPGFGPFQIYQCRSCSSLLTHPVPGSQEMAALYESFETGMHKKARDLRTRYPLRTWFLQCLDHMMKGTSLNANPEFSWIDVGAGNGEMVSLIHQTFPASKGTAVDYHERPAHLNNNVNWIRADLSSEMSLMDKADLVFALTVLEHMTDPVQFIRSCLDLMKPGGVFYFNCPRADANFFRILGKKWPYYLPGEHITVPSISGLSKLMQRECSRKFGDRYTLNIYPVVLPYPLGFYIGYLLPATMKYFSLSTDIYFPTGMLECQLILHDPH